LQAVLTGETLKG